MEDCKEMLREEEMAKEKFEKQNEKLRLESGMLKHPSTEYTSFSQFFNAHQRSSRNL